MTLIDLLVQITDPRESWCNQTCWIACKQCRCDILYNADSRLSARFKVAPVSVCFLKLPSDEAAAAAA